MPRFAANLSFLFQDIPFLDRFEAARRAGFAGVEYLFPYEHSPAELAGHLQRLGLRQALFNMPPGDWAAGERGIAVLPGREREFAAGVEEALGYARALGCERVHAMAGVLPAGVSRADAETAYVANLKAAAARLAPHGIQVLIEPINTRDMPGYFLTTLEEARRIIDRVGHPNLLLQMDLYHAQIMGGDLATRIEAHLPATGHIQIANPPNRNEPDSGEVNYAYVFELIDSLGYGGWIGCEYKPRAGTVEGLGWARAYGIGGAQ